MDHIRQEEEDIKQETQLALQLKIAQEKRLKEAKLAEIQETRLARMFLIIYKFIIIIDLET